MSSILSNIKWNSGPNNGPNKFSQFNGQFDDMTPNWHFIIRYIWKYFSKSMLLKLLDFKKKSFYRWWSIFKSISLSFSFLQQQTHLPEKMTRHQKYRLNKWSRFTSRLNHYCSSRFYTKNHYCLLFMLLYFYHFMKMFFLWQNGRYTNWN